MKVLRTLYTWSISIRRTILMTVFGVVYECKHQPTCGAYTMQQIEERGFLRGIALGVWRVARCW